MCTIIFLTAFQHLRTSVSITTCCPARHWCLDSEGYHMLPVPLLPTFLLTPILSTSLHSRYLSHPSTIPDIFCHTYAFSFIFHMAQAHCSMPPPFPIGPLFQQPNLPTPLYNTSFSPNSIYFLHYPEDRSSKLLHNADSYIQIYTA